ncbi:MAG: cardiolipin synthase [Planctomycetota bacterium]
MSWTLLYYISEWVIRLVMLPVVVRKRRPAAATTWMLLIMFLPWGGLVLYLLVGNYRLPRRRSRKHARMRHDTPPVDGTSEHSTRPELEAAVMSTVLLAERLGEMPIVGGNRVELLADERMMIDRLVEDIDAAEHHVHLLFYIFDPDRVGRRVADALKRAAGRGVTCRVMVDYVGSLGFVRGDLWDEMAEAGVDMHASLSVRFIRRFMARIDLRNHRKIVVVDGRIGYTGSQNITDPDPGSRYRQRTIDLMARLEGPVVGQLQTVFADDWAYNTGNRIDGDGIFGDLPRPGNVAVQALPSGPNYPTENYQRLVVDAVHAAQQRVVITTPYFVPDDALMQALETAVLRDVQVDLVVPHKSDHPLVDAASRAYYEDLLACGVNVYRYGKGLLHAKTMVVDTSIGLIGSSNFDIRSFKLNFELNLLLYGHDACRDLLDKQDAYIADAEKLDYDSWRRRGPIKRTTQNIAKLLSPIL